MQGAIWASAVLSPYTGAGVFQREVYSRLTASGIRLVAPVQTPNGVVRVIQSLARVIGPPYAAAFICSSPAPFVVRVPCVVCVYDLRWRRTRGPGPHLYHHLNLRRLVARADHIFAISARTRDEMVELFPGAKAKCTVLHLGPGIVRQDDFRDGDAGVVLLAGRAGYKRNELVAEALVRARPDWARRFLCVGISDTAFATLVAGFGVTSCERFDNVDDDLMRDIFRRARVYITASLEEGFGLPMVEALTAGCQVVAIRQPLTTEIMGDAAVLIDDGDAADLARQLQHPQWVARETRLTRSTMYSWDKTTEAVAAVLDRVTR